MQEYCRLMIITNHKAGEGHPSFPSFPPKIGQESHQNRQNIQGLGLEVIHMLMLTCKIEVQMH